MGAECCKAGNTPTESPESATADDDTIKFLAQVQLFKPLPPELLPALVGVSERCSYENGENIIIQGEDGMEFFIIVSGAASVLVDSKAVASLGSGDYFGENALLRDEARSATIQATSSVVTLKISRDNFRKLGLNQKLEFQRRGAVGGGGAEVQVKPPSPKTPEERKLMEDAIRANANLKTMVELSQPQLDDLVSIAWKEDVAAGVELIQQDDLDANYFYIVQDGSFEVLVSGQESKSAEQASVAVGTVTKGGSFGELALLYFAPRAATVKATTSATVWVMDRVNFKNIVSKSSEAATKRYIEHLKKVDMLAALQEDERREVAKALVECVFDKGELIMTQGTPGDNFYLLVDGECSVVKDNKETAKLKGSKESPAFFGEQALVNITARTATIKVLSETATALSLDKATFELVLGPLDTIKKRGATGPTMVGRVSIAVKGPVENAQRFGNIKRKDLKRLGLLGGGGFGAVELVEHVTTKETYALKALSKGYVVKSGMQKGVMAEKEVQIMCDSPFIVKLYETYNGEQSLYLLLELALGGELYATYNKKDFFGREGHAKFYTAGVVYAFDHMDNKNIIFRDLKPENVLLTESGHVKVTDMGLAKVVAGKTHTTCGTPDYFAPELVQSAGHTRALDWWTLGVLTFELMVGRPPFESPSPMQIYQKVVRGINKVNFPAKLKPSCVSLIKALCKAEPSQRLPMTKGGIQNIMDHSWYEGFEWKAMKDLTLQVPYKPQVKNNKDIANFSARKEDMPPQIPYKDPGTGWDKSFATST